MAGLLIEKNKNAFNMDEALCCNFAAWDDNSFTCDISIGDKVRQSQADNESYQFSSTFTFQIDGDKDFGIFRDGKSKSHVNSVINYLSLIDIFQDSFGLFLSIILGWNVLGIFFGTISFYMLLGDLYATYLVML